MMFNCPVCGRLKCAYWPEHWVYRRGETYYCSENCYVVDLTRDMKMIHNVMRQRRGRKMSKLTLEIKKKAVEIAIDGGDPIEYLKRNGYEKAPDKMWSYIKMKLKEKDPATFSKIPDRRKVKKPEIPEPISGGPWEKMETPEDPVKLTGPIRIMDVPAEDEPEEEPEKPGERYQYTGMSVSGLGEFYFDRKHNAMTWTTEDGEEVVMDPVQWIVLTKEIPYVMDRLGAIGK